MRSTDLDISKLSVAERIQLAEGLWDSGAAEEDIAEAARWYGERSPGLGKEFLRAVDVTLAESAHMPEGHPVVRGKARPALLTADKRIEPTQGRCTAAGGRCCSCAGRSAQPKA
jgi:hypothetical protein